MPLHTVTLGASGTIATATYASDVAVRDLPKHTMPDQGVAPQAAYSIVRDELLLDGAMGGVVIAGMVVSIMRSMNPALVGPMPEGARAVLENIGVDLFVTGLGLNVAPAGGRRVVERSVLERSPVTDGALPGLMPSLVTQRGWEHARYSGVVRTLPDVERLTRVRPAL